MGATEIEMESSRINDYEGMEGTRRDSGDLCLNSVLRYPFYNLSFLCTLKFCVQLFGISI